MLEELKEEKYMHQFLQQALLGAKGDGSGQSISQINSVAGGCIHKAWRLTLSDGRQLFAKTAAVEDFPKLSFEASGLNSLAKFANKHTIEIPKPLLLKKFENGSVLFLPWLDLGNGSQTAIGKGLALLHQSSLAQHPEKFGWEEHGYIGAGPQIGGWKDSWGECFINLRLLPQLKIARKWGLNISDWKDLLESLIVFLERHKPKPTLVHGDLWSGNAGITKEGKAVIFDPAVWWADREVDIAMTRLFGGFSKDFYKGYESIFPLESTAESRVDIYNLYHLLNHANIFGGAYKVQCLTTLENIKRNILY
ncbi:fructosamine kinase family protein [Prochlorococcus sp. MIT 1307]|uniref:fructosamine kinase family protein n=1 Tax=Prochlorococcus sp. MIT 1307 TaxID=3096219 RepID=UPI002A755B13|nr:fructosamine kinase family protein [Prochlorococcus sp. MIT 1307]